MRIDRESWSLRLTVLGNAATLGSAALLLSASDGALFSGPARVLLFWIAAASSLLLVAALVIAARRRRE